MPPNSQVEAEKSHEAAVRNRENRGNQLRDPCSNKSTGPFGGNMCAFDGKQCKD